MPTPKLERGYRFKTGNAEYELIELYSKEIPALASVKNVETGLYTHCRREDIPGYSEEMNLIFTVSSSKNEAVNSPVLKGYSGSKMYFTRFGLMKKDFTGYFQFPHGKESNPFARPEMNVPDIPGYQYCRKPVRDGFLYVYDQYLPDSRPDAYHEYRVERGRLRKILWTAGNQGDIRKPSDDFTDFHRIPVYAEAIWVAYSEVQWSRSYASKLLDPHSASAKELREKRFTKVSVEEWFARYDYSGSNNYNDTLAINDVALLSETYVANHVSSPLTGAIHNFISYAQTEQRLAEANREEQKKQGLTLFFTVHDPLGCAEDITEDLSMAYAELDAYIASLSSAKSQEEILKEILAAVNVTEEEDESQPEQKPGSASQDYMDMFSSGLTLYQTLYKGRSMEKYAKKVQKEKLTGLLAVDERAAIRRRITCRGGLRDSLGTLLHSNYYQSVWIDYLDNIDTNRLSGQIQCAMHLNLLATLPEFRDAFLDIKEPWEKSERQQDTWTQFLHEAFFYEQEEVPEENPEFRLPDEPYQNVCRVLLNKGLDGTWKDDPQTASSVQAKGPDGVGTSRDVPSGGELLDKVGIFLYTLFGLVGQTFKNKGEALMPDCKMLRVYRNQLNRQANNFTADKEAGQKVFQIEEKRLKDLINRGKKYQSTIRKHKRTLKNLRISNVNNNILYKDVITEVRRRASDVSHDIMELRTEWMEYKDQAKKFDPRMAENKYFKASLGALTLLNFSLAMRSIIEDVNPKNGVNLAAATAELSSIMIAMVPKRDVRLGGTKLAKLLGKTTIRLSIQIGWGAAGIGVIMSVWDTVDRARAGDLDAAVAYGVAAVAGAVSVGAGIACYAGLAVAGPIGWVALGVALVATFLAVWLTDDDLETFLQCTVFCAKNKLKRPGTPHQVKTALCESREQYASVYSRTLCNEYKLDIDMGDFYKMREWITNLLINFKLQCELRPITYHAEARMIDVRSGKEKKKYFAFVPRFRITCKFSYARPGVSDFSYFMLIFPSGGAGKGAFIPLESNNEKTLKDEDDRVFPITRNLKGEYEVEMDFIFRDELREYMRGGGKVYSTLMFVFGCRVIVDEEKQEYWPLSRNREELYVGYSGRLVLPAVQNWNEVKANYSKHLTQSRVFGTKEEIIDMALKGIR